MDICIAEVRKSEKKKKNIGGAESNIEGAELSIGGAEGHPKSIQIDTSAGKEIKSNFKNTKTKQAKRFQLHVLFFLSVAFWTYTLFFQCLIYWIFSPAWPYQLTWSSY